MKTSHFSFLLPQPKVSSGSNFDSTQITSHKYKKTTKNIHKETFFLSLLPIHKHKHTWKCLPFCFMVSVLLRWSSRREWGEAVTGLLVQEKGVVPQHRGQGCVFVCVCQWQRTAGLPLNSLVLLIYDLIHTEGESMWMWAHCNDVSVSLKYNAAALVCYSEVLVLGFSFRGKNIQTFLCRHYINDDHISGLLDCFRKTITLVQQLGLSDHSGTERSWGISACLFG